ncbi:MAG: hypothetical protein NT049_07100 [Planctomycetota bacterium]|nr:hypothetical protein [Planctomycetota bacterium]
MKFRWNEWNIDHVAEHGVQPREAEGVVEQAREHEWEYEGNGKWLIRGRGLGGQWLQAIFLIAPGRQLICDSRAAPDCG